MNFSSRQIWPQMRICWVRWSVYRSSVLPEPTLSRLSSVKYPCCVFSVTMVIIVLIQRIFLTSAVSKKPCVGSYICKRSPISMSLFLLTRIFSYFLIPRVYELIHPYLLWFLRNNIVVEGFFKPEVLILLLVCQISWVLFTIRLHWGRG